MEGVRIYFQKSDFIQIDLEAPGRKEKGPQNFDTDIHRKVNSRSCKNRKRCRVRSVIGRNNRAHFFIEGKGLITI